MSRIMVDGSRLLPPSKDTVLMFRSDVDNILKFVGCASETFSDNLLFVRDSMEQMLGWLVREGLRTEVRQLSDLCADMEESNPFGLPRPDIYERSLKDLLFAFFSGMRADVPWDGREAVRDGDEIILGGGTIIVYRLWSREAFRKELYDRAVVAFKPPRWIVGGKNSYDHLDVTFGISL